MESFYEKSIVAKMIFSVLASIFQALPPLIVRHFGIHSLQLFILVNEHMYHENGYSFHTIQVLKQFTQ